MTPEQRRKKVYDLTYAHLLRPDPVNWLVAADLLEEDGKDLLSGKWRTRATHFPLLLAAYRNMQKQRSLYIGTTPVHVEGVMCGEVRYVLRYTSKRHGTVRAEALQCKPGDAMGLYLSGTHWSLRHEHTSRTVNWYAVSLIDSAFGRKRYLEAMDARKAGTQGVQ